MKRLFMFAALSTALVISAAEPEEITFLYGSTPQREKYAGKNFKEIKDEIALGEKAFLAFSFPDAPVGTIYRLVCNLKAEKDGIMLFTLSKDGEENAGFRHVTVQGGDYSPCTLYFERNLSEIRRFQFELKGGAVFVKDIKLEKLSTDDLKGNLYPEPPMAPSNWRILWGAKYEPVLFVDEPDSPFDGKILKTRLLPMQQGNGFITTVSLPFVSNRKFKLEIWVRGGSDGTAKCMFRAGKQSIVKTIPLRTEWKKIVLEDTTPSGPLGARDEFFLMFFAAHDGKPDFAIADLKFQYE
ncbi:MAG: hypothetical protein BWY31_01528 [Lentisphaerae bacterium ADurb.Bin242]|nr:MAG: hypothetical protein BWY31_01528 [Lentisphaerae bacterium ADurb.Bin242]